MTNLTRSSQAWDRTWTLGTELDTIGVRLSAVKGTARMGLEDDAQGAAPKLHTVASELVRGILRGAESIGLSRGEMLAAMGPAASVVDMDEGRIDHQSYRRLWDYLAAHVPDEPVALLIAERVGEAAESWVAQLALLSHTLDEAVGPLVRFFRLFSEGERVTARRSDEGMSLEVTGRDLVDLPRPELYEFWLGRAATFGRQVVGGSLVPAAVTLKRSARHHAVFGRLFGSNVRFDAPRHTITFSRSDLARSSVGSQPKLRKLVQERVETLATQLPDSAATALHVQRALISLLPLGRATLTETARACGISARTLQRRLADEETTFAGVLDDVRYVFARELLRRPGFTIGAVAFELGFSSHAAFHSAFLRWSGQTPGQFRAGN